MLVISVLRVGFLVVCCASGVSSCCFCGNVAILCFSGASFFTCRWLASGTIWGVVQVRVLVRSILSSSSFCRDPMRRVNHGNVHSPFWSLTFCCEYFCYGYWRCCPRPIVCSFVAGSSPFARDVLSMVSAGLVLKTCRFGTLAPSSTFSNHDSCLVPVLFFNLFLRAKSSSKWHFIVKSFRCTCSEGVPVLWLLNRCCNSVFSEFGFVLKCIVYVIQSTRLDVINLSIIAFSVSFPDSTYSLVYLL